MNTIIYVIWDNKRYAPKEWSDGMPTSKNAAQCFQCYNALITGTEMSKEMIEH